MIEFQIANHANQRFATVLNGKRVILNLWYAVFNDRWSIDIFIDDEPVLTGRKIVPGVDLLEAFDLDIGVIFAWSEKSKNPGRDELPQGLVKLYHSTREEIDASMVT